MKLQIEGMEALQRQLGALKNPTLARRRAMEKTLMWVEENGTKYPPATIANRPPGPHGYSWYVRNYGTKTVTGRSYPTSEQLSKRWEFRVERAGNNLRGVIENLASYSQDVQGENQAWYHANRGWKNLPKFIRAGMDEIIRIHQREIEADLEKKS